MVDKLMRSAGDLLALAKALHGSHESLEHDIAMEMEQTAIHCSDYFSVVSTLLFIQDHMVNAADRAVVKEQVSFVVDGYVKQIGFALEVVNLGLADTNKPAIAEAGGRLRDTLREGQALLETLPK